MGAIRGRETVERFARDGYALGAARFPVTGRLRGRIVVAGATGVPQGFYARFATHAAAHGFETLTFDYRGIGRSKQGSLAGFEASFLDWARLDLAGVVDAVPQDDVPLFLVAHSFGGHALGLLPNHDRFAGAWACAVGAGWHGWMRWGERLRVLALWNLVLPPYVAWKGYLAWSRFGMGEDLPRDVYRQWRRWCRYPHYFLDDPEQGALREACAAVRVPILAVTALDDAWAPPRSRDAFLLHAYPEAEIRGVDVDPASTGPIGHMGYFRSAAQGLWDEALAFFADRASSTASAGRAEAPARAVEA